MEIKQVDITKLVPYSKNAKKHDKVQIDNVAESIKQFGMVQPIVIDKENVVVIGHCRLEACKKLGYKEVPCVIVDDLTEEQVAKLRLLDNKLNESDWDYDLLSEELENLDLVDFEIDWRLLELEEENKEVEEDDFDVEAEVEEITEPATKLGDIYQLGNHRLMCGDSTKAEDVERLMGGEKADLLLTDPPYGIDYSGKNSFLNAIDKGNRIQKDIINDNIEDYKKFFSDIFSNIKSNLAEYNICYVFLLGKELHNLRLAFDEQGYHWNDYLVWVKNNHVLGRNDYNCKLEYIMYGWFGKHKFYGDFSTNVLEFKRPSKSDLHPTMKPIELLCKLIKDGSRENANVLDVFGGSGSTLIACEQLERNCYMMELDPKYVDVIINRWEQFTGKKAEKLN